MKVKIDKSRKVYKGNLYSGRINENKYEVLEFEFPQELEDFTKYIEIEATDSEGTLRYADRIEDNEFAIDNTLSKYSLITAQVVCKDLTQNVVFKSNPFEFTFEQSLNIMEDIEEEQQDLLDRIELELQEAKEDITDLQETQTQHTEQIQTNTTNITTLQEQVTTNETDIANIETKNTQQDTAIETNTQDISDIKTEQTTQNSNILSNTNRITVLEAQSGNKVALSINSNYVMTLQLLNKNNEVLSTGTIDLPIESMVVNVSYSNGILTLTLQNGQTLNVDISDIVSGLVSETTFNTAISELQSSITALQGRMTTAENNIANKVDKVTGKGLSTNDYTTEEKNKLADLENYDDTEVKADIQENADDIVALEAKHDAEVAELNEKIEALEDQIPTGTVTGESITINDSARYEFKEFEVEGNSEQTQYTGQQLYNVNDRANVAGATADEDGWITVTRDNSNGTATVYSRYYTNNLNLEENKQYKIVVEIKNVSGTGNLSSVSMSGNEGQFNNTINWSFAGLQNNNIKTITPTTLADLTSQKWGLRTLVYFNAGQSGSITFRISVLEDTTVTADTFTYEPFVGGQASPNPDYTQEIRNVGDNVNLFDKETVTLDKYLNNLGEPISYDKRAITDYIYVKDKKVIINHMGNWSETHTCYYDDNKQFISSETASSIYNNNNKFTIPSNAYYMRASIHKNWINDLKIEYGEVSSGYSPYNCGSINVKVQTNNLYDENSEYNMNASCDPNNNNYPAGIGDNRYTYFFKVKSNTTYTFSCKEKGDRLSIFGVNDYINPSIYTLEKRLIFDDVFYKNISSGDKNISFITGQNTKMVAIYYSLNNIPSEIMIEEGSTVSSYVPHEEQIVTFPLAQGQVLHLRDTLEDDGIHQRRFTRVFDGTENWSAFTISGIYSLMINNMKLQNGTGFMSHYKLSTAASIADLPINHFRTKGGNGELWVRTEYTTLADFKTFLAEQYANGTPVTLESVLAEPIIVPYTEAQQQVYDEIKELYSYKGTTYISSDNEPSPIFNITYRKDIETMLDKINELDARLSLLE